MNSRRFSCLGLASLIIVSQILIGATSVVNVNSINNQSEDTYKTTDDSLKKAGSYIDFTSDKINYNNFTQDKSIKNYSVEESWLLDNNILTNDINLSSDDLKVNSTLRPDLLNGDVNKADFLMALSKGAFGIQESRPLIIHTKNKETYQVDPTNQNNVLDLSEGNYNVYTTPNVYEQYFTTLLSKGFINIADFKNLDFINDYNSFGKNGTAPVWAKSLGNYNCTSDTIGSQLGYSVSLTQNGTNFSTSFAQPDYFIDNSITTMDALKMVEKVLRSTEKDMTDTESKIVSYKYGVDYLMKLDDSSKSTIMYLIARGILNFEDPKDFQGLYNPLTKDKLVEILYRTFNKNARLDFSKVQLTDSDNYWLSKGFYQGTITYNNNSSDEIYEGSVKPFTADDQVSQVNSVVKSRDIVLNDGPANGETSYIVERTFGPADEYTYKGIKISDLKKGTPAEINDDPTSDGKKMTVQFKINAPTSVAAAALVDNRVIRTSDGSSVVSKVTGIVKVQAGSDSNNTDYFVPQAELEKDNNELKVLDDLLLINSNTNARCVILQKQGVALIGNEVVDCDGTPMVQGFNGETYYNLKLIVKLMSKHYLNELNPGDVFTFSGEGSMNETLKDVYSADHQTKLDSAYTYDINTRPAVSDDYTVPKTSKKFFSMGQTMNTFSYLYRDVSSISGLSTDELKYPVYMVVNWEYSLPKNSDLNSSVLGSLEKQFPDRDNPSVDTMTNFLSTRPSDPQLGQWWDSNIGLSNALCNYIYGSKDVKYFSSGYLTPSVTLLSRTTLSIDQQKRIMNSIKLDSSYLNQFAPNGDLISSLFGSSNGTSIYNKLKSSRQYAYLEGFHQDDIEGVDFCDYALDKCGVLYRDYGNVNYSYGEQRMMDYSNSTSPNKGGSLNSGNGSLVIQQRDYAYGLNEKQLYTVDGKEYMLTGEKSVNGRMAYQLTATEGVKGTISYDEDYKVSWTSDDGQSILDLARDRSPNYGSDEHYIVGNEEDHITGFPSISNDYPPTDSSDFTYYFERKVSFSEDGNSEANGVTAIDKDGRVGLGGKVAVSDNSNVVTNYQGGLSSNSSPCKANQDGGGGSEVIYYPVIYLNRCLWQDDGTGTLTKCDGASFFSRENLRNIGVTNSVIDAVVDNSYGVKNLGDIPDKAKVLIGDLSFTCSNGTLMSDPVSNQQLALALAGRSDNDTVVKSSLAKLFDGANINIIQNGSVVSGQGLIDYITIDPNNGKLDLDIGDLADGVDNSNNALIKRNGALAFINGGKLSQYNPNTIPDSVVFSVKFNDKIRFRPVNADKTVWTISYNSSAGSDGYVSDVPYFTGTLGFTWYDDVFNNLLQSKYATASDPSGLMAKLKAYFMAQFRNDIFGWMKMVCTVLIFYMWIINLVVFVTMKCLPTAQTFFERLNSPNGGRNRGFDILKFLTFGCQSITREITFVRWFGFEFLMALILLIVWKYL